MTHILRTSTEHKTASLADEGNYAYCQSSGAHNIKHILPAESLILVTKVLPYLSLRFSRNFPLQSYTLFTLLKFQ